MKKLITILNTFKNRQLSKVNTKVEQLKKDPEPTLFTTLENKLKTSQDDSPYTMIKQEIQETNQKELVKEGLQNFKQQQPLEFPEELNQASADDIEKAVGISIKTLSNPKNIQHFSDIDDKQIAAITLGLSLGKAIQFHEYVALFTQFLDLSVSKSRKGRIELKDVGIAGVNREKTDGLVERMKGLFNR